MDDPVKLAGGAGWIPLDEWFRNRIDSELDAACRHLAKDPARLRRLLLRLASKVEERAMQLPSEMTDGVRGYR